MAEQEDFDFEGHAENLERVSTRIAWAIGQFLKERLSGASPRFHADDLRKHVIRETGIAAPASADRVMRDLRQKGIIDYACVSRRESLYEAIRVGKKEAA